MPKILYVKTSSLGDIVHALPAVSDIRARFPDAEIDWVAEEAFAAIPRLHPGVARVIPVAIRRWRRQLGRAATWRELRAFRAELRARRYDWIIDSQGLLKSALVATLADGRRGGYDGNSAREPLAARFYQERFAVPRALHAVTRNRELAARVLGYSVPPELDYGIRTAPLALPWAPAEPYAVLLHGTSHQRKLWSEDCWAALGNRLARHGWRAVLPWGSAAEEARSRRLAERIPGARVPPRLTLDEAATLLAGARAVVGVDTGLSHLAAALAVPTVGVFVATDPGRTGLYAPGARNLGGIGKAPDADDVAQALAALP